MPSVPNWGLYIAVLDKALSVGAQAVISQRLRLENDVDPASRLRSLGTRTAVPLVTQGPQTLCSADDGQRGS